MNVVLLLWRTRLRSTWRSAVVLVVVIGLGGAVSLAVAAGARRTASAYGAVLDELNSSDVVTAIPPGDPDAALAALRSLPDVSGAELWIGFTGQTQGIPPAAIPAFLGFWSERPGVDRPFLTSGRLPAARNEAFLNQGAADRSGLRVGSKLQLDLADQSFSDFKPVEVEIVGIGLLPDTMIEDELTNKVALWFSRAFTEEHIDRMVYGSARLTLGRGDVPALAAGLAAMRAGSSDNDDDLVIGEVREEDRQRVQKALRPLLWAMAGLALLAGVTTALVATQALGRTLRRRRLDDQSLAAMGCTTRQLVAADLAYAVSVVGGGIVVAVALAVAASPLFPVGPARRFTTVIGVHADLVALGLGGLALMTTIVVLAGVASWRRRTRPGTPRPGGAPGLLGSRPASSAGLRLVTGRRGTISTIVGVSAGLAAVVAALTFTGSLDHLVADPALVGMGWDVVGREGYTEVDVAQVRNAVQDDPSVRRVSGIGYLDGELNGVTTPLAAMEPVVGDPWPPIIAGRAPRSSREIMVGDTTLRALDLRIGDEVNVSVAASLINDTVPRSETRRFTVVGSAIVPAIGLVGIYSPRLDVGALLPAQAFLEMFGTPPRTDVVLFDLDRHAAAPALIDRFPDGLPDANGIATEWYTSAVPAEISQAEEARRVIWLAVAALGLAVVATIAHTLLGLVRQRRRDYAVLKTLGFTRSQIRTTVLTQSGAVLAVALAAALPLGAAAGRWLWTAFAGRIGVIVEPVVPLLLLAACALLSILAVQGAALIPASLASRTPAGRTLHGE